MSAWYRCPGIEMQGRNAVISLKYSGVDPLYALHRLSGLIV